MCLNYMNMLLAVESNMSILVCGLLPFSDPQPVVQDKQLMWAGMDHQSISFHAEVHPLSEAKKFSKAN